VAEHACISVDGSRGWQEREVLPSEVLAGFVWLDPHGDTVRGIVAGCEPLEEVFAYRLRLVGGFECRLNPWQPVRVLVDIARADDAEHWLRAS